MITLTHFAPEGPKQISPGQGNTSFTSVSAALGRCPFKAKALKGCNKTVALPVNLATCFDLSGLERGINNPRWGPDHWIYVGAGGLGGTIEGPHLDAPVPIGDTDFRIRADGTAIEPLSGKVHTFGLALNEVGDRFLSSSGVPVDYGLPLPDRYLRRNPDVASPPGSYKASDYNTTFRISQPHPWRVKRRQDPAWIKFYGEHETSSAYYTADCGVEFYFASLFPEE